jgi:FkbM family methyltransferase
MLDSQPGALLWHHGNNDELSAVRRRRSGWGHRTLRKPGLSPRTVIDVGAEHGTGALYMAFPRAYYVLIEPLSECAPSLERWLQRIRGEYLQLGVADSEESLTFYADLDHHWAGSFVAPRAAANGSRVEKRDVEVTTLDCLRRTHSWEGPFGLKIDTEGFERQVLEGAVDLLGETQFVIVELWIADHGEQTTPFAELVALLDERGFRLSDLLDGAKASPDGDLLYVDALFRRKPQGRKAVA